MGVMNLRFSHSLLREFSAVAIFAAAFFSPCVVRAGVVIKGEQRLREGEPAINTYVAISDGNARTESVLEGHKVTMIYRSDKDLFWLVDDTAKTYREMTRSELGKMMKQVNKALQEVREQFAALPPEQRKMMEEMMGDQLAAVARQDHGTPEISYVKVGDGGELNGWPTVKYEGKLDGAKASEVWVAPASVVKVGPAELNTMENMMSFFREFAGKLGVDSLTALGPAGGLEGVPVKAIVYSGGAPASTYVVKSIEQRKLPASNFEVPSEYTKEALTAPGWQ